MKEVEDEHLANDREFGSDTISAKLDQLSLRQAGCKCPSPLVDFRPDAGLRCLFCNIEA